jgi:putative transposase
MARKRHTPEEIIGELREAEVLIAEGRSVADAAKARGATEQSHCRWREEYGGPEMDRARRPEEPERENARLRKAVADLTLDKPVLKEAVSANC